jgi:PAS domain S-box-containing protein
MDKYISKPSDASSRAILSAEAAHSEERAAKVGSAQILETAPTALPLPRVGLGKSNLSHPFPLGSAQDSFGDFLMHLAITFVNILPENIDEEIMRALAMTGRFTGVDRAYVMDYDFSRRTVVNTHEWCADGIEPMIDELQSVPMEGLEEGWLDVHLKGETVHVPSVPDLPASGALRRLLEPQGITTLVAVPMTYGNRCLGFVGFDAVRHHVDWTAEQLALVRMLAELFTNAEMSRRRIQALRDEQSKHKGMRLLLQKAVDASGIAVWELEQNGRTVNMVSGWDRLLGVAWDGREIELEEFKARVHQEDLDRVDQVVAGYGGRFPDTRSLEFRLMGAGGEWRRLRAWWVEEPAGGETTVRMYGGTMDVSDTHLRSEAQLLLNRISSRFVDLESQEQAVALSLPEITAFCSAADAELVLSDDLPEGFVNRWRDDRGLRQDYFAGLWQMIAGNAEARQRLAEGVSMVATEDGTVEPLLLPPGSEGVVLGQGSAIWVPLRVGGELKAVISVTDPGFCKRTSLLHVDFLSSCAEVMAGALGRAQSEWTLLENVKRKQVILNSLKEVIFLTDPMGSITFINQAGAAFCGESANSVIGRPVSAALGPASRASLSFFTPPYGKEETLVCSTEGLGQARTLQLSRKVMTDDRGAVSGVLGIINDITEQQAWESHLISQKIQAESSSKDKTLYISNLSHELRTPMHGVLGILELMVKSGKLDADNNRLAEFAQRSGRDLLRLFDDLLEIARLESGAVQIHPGEIDLRKMLDQMLFPFRSEAARRGIALELEIAKDMPDRILADDLRLRQIIGNLVSNAIKYTDEGTVRILLSLSGEEEGAGTGDGRRIRLSVEDTGIGIDPRDIGLLFTPFVKINSFRNRSVEGSGLGLAITQELVNLLHGEISVRSEIGKGTAVKVLLPLTLPDGQGNASEESCEDDQVLGRMCGLSVLVAEDNVINRMLASEHLSSMGCRVTTVENGMEAVHACAKEDFAYVIMDLSMPVMNGYAAAKKIIADSPSFRAAPVILGCTADASEYAAARCLEAGMRSVIVKPFTRDELARTMKSFARQAPLTPGAADPIELPGNLAPERRVLNETVLGSLESNLSGSGLAVMEEILALFRHDSLRKIEDIREAVRCEDFARTSETAHSLKGSSCSLGADRLSALCAWIENASRALLKGGVGGPILPAGIDRELLKERAAFLDQLEARANIRRQA